MEKDSAGIDFPEIIGKDREQFQVFPRYDTVTILGSVRPEPTSFAIRPNYLRDVSVSETFPEFDTKEEAEAELVKWNGPPFPEIAGFAVLLTPQDAADWHATRRAFCGSPPDRLPCMVYERFTADEETAYLYLYRDDIAAMGDALREAPEVPAK